MLLLLKIFINIIIIIKNIYYYCYIKNFFIIIKKTFSYYYYYYLKSYYRPDAKKRPNVRKLLRHPFVCDNNDDQNQSKSRSSRDSINKSRTSCRPLRVIPEENTLECNVSATGSVKKNDDKFL